MVFNRSAERLFQLFLQAPSIANSSANTRLLRSCCFIHNHTRSIGINSGEYGGKKSRVIESGTFNALALCQPAPSKTSTTCTSLPASSAIIRKCTLINVVLTVGEISADDWPVNGSTAPKMYAHLYSVWRTARGRLPRCAHTRVNVPCWPTRASSWNQTATRLSLCFAWTLRTKKGRRSPTFASLADQTFDAEAADQAH
jgi:hypothetical protein